MLECVYLNVFSLYSLLAGDRCLLMTQLVRFAFLLACLGMLEYVALLPADVVLHVQ